MNYVNSMSLIKQNIRSLSSSAVVCAKNHYDVLGVTPKATQADIKGAYYKLSMTYHPDKNEGCQTSARRFRDISEAYEVLGNIRLRKLYDKGVSHIGGDIVPDDPSVKFYKSREHRSRPPFTGRTPIYDFDEWSKSHYGATFARDMERKRNAQMYRDINNNEKQDIKFVQLFVAMGALFAFTIYLQYDASNADRVTYKANKTQQTPKVD